MQIFITLVPPFLALPAPAPGHAVSLPELLLLHLPSAHVLVEWQLTQLGRLFSPPCPHSSLGRPEDRAGAQRPPEPPPPGRGSGARRSHFCPGTRRVPRGPIRSAGGDAEQARPQEPPAPPRGPHERSGTEVRSRPTRCRRSHRSAAAAPEALPASTTCRRGGGPGGAGGREGGAGLGAAAGQAPGPR